MSDMKRLMSICEAVDLSDPVQESAPPGKKAERFIKKSKKIFKKRYGKNWERVLYATAWKQFGEGATFHDCLSILEAIQES